MDFTTYVYLYMKIIKGPHNKKELKNPREQHRKLLHESHPNENATAAS